MNRVVSSVALSGAMELIEAYGQDPFLIASQSDVPKEALFSTDLNVNGRNICDFFENSARACNERFFGLEMAKRQGLQMLGPIWLLMRNSKTVIQALNSLRKNFQLHTDITAISLEKEFNGLSFCYEIVDENIQFESQIIEHGLALTCLELRTMLGNNWRPKFTQFRYSAPYNLGPLKEVFGDNISFNQDRHAIHLTEQDLAISNDRADGEYQQILQQQLKPRIDATGEQIAHRTEMAIRMLMPVETCQLNKVASVMGISPRSLQRYLHMEGLSFQLIHDKVKLDMAIKYLLHSNLTIASIAERLHFAETAVFTRFFKRKTGMTPRGFLQGEKH